MLPFPDSSLQTIHKVSAPACGGGDGEDGGGAVRFGERKSGLLAPVQSTVMITRHLTTCKLLASANPHFFPKTQLVLVRRSYSPTLCYHTRHSFSSRNTVNILLSRLRVTAVTEAELQRTR